MDQCILTQWATAVQQTSEKELTCVTLMMI